MSLQVWLPFCKDWNNQGIFNLGNYCYKTDNTQLSEGGKIGKYCLNVQGVLYNVGSEFLGNKWSLCAWVKSSSWSNVNDVILCLNNSSTSDTQFYFSIYQGRILNIGANNVNQSQGSCQYEYTFSTDIWYHVGATYDGTTLTLFLNGEQVATKEYTGTFVGRKYLGIGNRANNSSGTAVWSDSYKYLNDIRIYDHVLSKEEVKEISKGLVLHYNFEDVVVPLNNEKYNNNLTIYNLYTGAHPEVFDGIITATLQKTGEYFENAPIWRLSMSTTDTQPLNSLRNQLREHGVYLRKCSF